MNKTKTLLISVVILVIATLGCEKSFLEVTPKGVLTAENLSDPEHIDGFVVAAYCHVATRGVYDTHYGWFHGDGKSDNHYKGGSGLTDQTPYHEMEMFAPVTTNVGNNAVFWNSTYASISRINAALRQLNSVTADDYPLKVSRIAEMRFLRAFCHLSLKQRYKWMPYITEDMTVVDIKSVPNRPADAENDLGLWQLILDDFTFAADNLPPTQSDKGRPTEWTAKAYMVKTLLWMAYPQNETHQVIDIDETALTTALSLCNDIIDHSGKALTADISENFMPETENNIESLFEFQFSINDGTTAGRQNSGMNLNTPRWQPYYRCCDFNKSSYNLVNAFRTGANGLPLLDTFNDAELHNNYTAYFGGNTFDPRISHTCGIPGHPWKYDPELLYDSLGSRNPDVYGYIHSTKEQVHPFSRLQYQNRGNSMNWRVLRFAQVLLWKAEILIKLGREDEALPVINQIRQRSNESQGRLKMADGSPVLNYNIALYEDGVNCTWDNAFAWKAYMFEDRLELAGEGTRFFNLVRWGIAADVLNAYFEKEAQRRSWNSNAFFTSGKHEYLPIPQDVINLSEGVYVQNINY